MEENQSVQTPTPAKKEKKGCPVALIIILAILAVGGIGFGIYGEIRANQKVPCVVNIADYGDESEVGTIINTLENEIIETGNGLAETNRISDTAIFKPAYELDNTNAFIPFEKSLGLEYMIKEDTNFFSEKDTSKKVASQVEQKILELGFEKIHEDNSSFYANKKMGIYCRTNLIKEELVLSEINCSSEKWKQSDEYEKTAKELIAAYRKESEESPMYIYLKEIEKSNYEQYEIINAVINYSDNLFYRENPEAEWVYAFELQPTMNCNGIGELEAKIYKEKLTCYDNN